MSLARSQQGTPPPAAGRSYDWHSVASGLGTLGLATLIVGGLGYSLRERNRLPGVTLDAYADARAAEDRGDLARAARQYKTALRLNPADSGPARSLADVEALLGDREGEIAARRTVARLESWSPEAHLKLGLVLLQAGELASAADSLSRSIQLDAGASRQATGNAHAALAQARLRQGQALPAIESYKKALEIRPRHPPFMNEMGIALVAAGRVAEAITFFEAALAIEPDAALAANLERARARLGDLEPGRAASR